MTTKYTIRDTAAGYAVVRADGSYAEFLGRDEAEEALALLTSGAAEAADYEWTN